MRLRQPLNPSFLDWNDWIVHPIVRQTAIEMGISTEEDPNPLAVEMDEVAAELRCRGWKIEEYRNEEWDATYVFGLPPQETRGGE